MSNPNDPKDEGQKPKLPSSVATPKFKRGLKGFMADTSREMKKVNWPTKKETNRLTFVVLSLVILVALLLSAFGVLSGTVVNIVTTGGRS